MQELAALESMKSQIVIAMLATVVIQKLKQISWFPFIHQGTPNTNKLISVLIATASGAGFALGFTGTLEAGSTLTVTIPPIQKFVEFLVDAGFSYGVQQGWYHGYVKQEIVAPPAPPAPPAPQPKGE